LLESESKIEQSYEQSATPNAETHQAIAKSSAHLKIKIGIGGMRDMAIENGARLGMVAAVCCAGRKVSGDLSKAKM
jgi:hypothetical protein